MTVGPIWNTGGTETEIIVPVSVLGPQWAATLEIVVAKILEYNQVIIMWFIVKDCSIIIKSDYHFPGENSHLKAEQTTPHFQTLHALCAFMSSKLNSLG